MDTVFIPRQPGLPPFSRYFQVNDLKRVWVKTGSHPGNHYYGSSQIYDVLGEELWLTPGDELHDLAGGLFAIVIDDGEAEVFEVLDRSPEEINRHFERDYTGPRYRIQRILAEGLIEVEKSEATVPDRYREKRAS